MLAGQTAPAGESSMLNAMRSASASPFVRPGSRQLVHVAVADPDLAQDCLATVAAAGLAARTCELADVVAGASILLVDAKAAHHVEPATADSAWNAADTAIAVCSELAATRPLGHEPLQLPRDTPELLRRLDAATETDTGGRMLAVAGAHGGAGASTFAVAAALEGAHSDNTVLIEADPHGPGLDLLISPTTPTELTLDAVHASTGDLDGTELFGALPRRRQLAIAANSRLSEYPSPQECATSRHFAAQVVARATVRAGFNAVCDLGAATTAPPALTENSDALVIVTRGTVAGLHQTERLLERIRPQLIAVRRDRPDLLRASDVEDWFAQLQRRRHCDQSSNLMLYKSSGQVFGAFETGALPRPRAAFAEAIEAAWEATGV